jgi:hypothetical protein
MGGRNNELVVEYMREPADWDIDWEQMATYFQPQEDDPDPGLHVHSMRR